MFVFRQIEEEDLPAVIALEQHSYPADEAASPERIRLRATKARTLFCVLVDVTVPYVEIVERAIVGFVNATRTKSLRLDEASMADHDPEGETVAIHSVVVDAAYQRRGLARFMLHNFVRWVCAEERDVRRAVLISKPSKAALYESVGFESAGRSAVVWGSEEWDEYRLGLRRAPGPPIFVVDAFADAGKRWSGNPAGVVVTKERVPAAAAQSVAMEMNQAETAFANPSPARDGSWELRWFTPTCEVDLCGHATLATAHALWSENFVPRAQARICFRTRSGDLFAAAGGVEDGLPSIELDFPLEPPLPLPSDPSAPFPAAGPRYAAGDAAPAAQGLVREHVVSLLSGSLGLAAEDVLHVAANRMDVLVELSPRAFLALPTPLAALASLAALPARGIILTCRASEGYRGEAEAEAEGEHEHEHEHEKHGAARTPRSHLLADVDAASRCFFPRAGVDEDPVTGSAHCALLPYWRGRLGREGPLRLRQCSARTGIVLAAASADGRARLRGLADTVLRGTLAHL